MNAVQTYFPDHSFGSQLGTSPILGTSGVKNPAICKDLVGAVGVEPTFRGLGNRYYVLFISKRGSVVFWPEKLPRASGRACEVTGSYCLYQPVLSIC
jgi:hypothetical protein